MLMAKAPENSGSDFEIVPAGTHLARCYSIIDLGTQEVEWQGKFKYQHKVLVQWELYGDEEDPLTVEIKGEQKPMIIGKKYTLVLSDKSALYKDLVSWRGKAFTQPELEGFDISKLVGVPAMLTVTHSEGNNGKTYANVSSVSGVPKAMRAAIPEPINEPRLFELDDFDAEVYDSLSDYLKETISKSPEYKNRNNPAPVNAVADIDDDIPF